MNYREQIEILVQQKKTKAAKRFIGEWLRRKPSEENVFQSVQFYRRLSLYKDALRLVMSRHPFEPHTSRSIKLVTAELLSHTGANSYALQIIENFSPIDSRELGVFAGIYFSSGNYQKALELYSKKVDLAPDPLTYEMRLVRLSQADCLSSLGRLDEAIKASLQLMRESEEILFIAICQQAIGEFYALKGQTKTALKWLLKSKKEFPGEGTYDHALLYRWLGYVYAKLKRRKLALKYFGKSTGIILETGLGDSIWLGNLRYQGELGLLPQKDFQRLQLLMNLGKSSLNKNQLALDLPAKKGSLKIFFDSNEYEFNGESFLGLPLEIRLIGYLRVAGEWGISFEKLKSVFWPTEGRSYLQLESRLRQMLKRIKRQYKINYVIQGKRISLLKSALDTVSVIYDGIPVPQKIRDRKAFTRKDFEKLYNLKKAQAANWLDLLVQQKILTYVGQGKATRYILLSYQKA